MRTPATPAKLMLHKNTVARLTYRKQSSASQLPRHLSITTLTSRL